MRGKKEMVKRCFNCNCLIAGTERDVCIKCLENTIKEEKSASQHLKTRVRAQSLLKREVKTN